MSHHGEKHLLKSDGKMKFKIQSLYVQRGWRRGTVFLGGPGAGQGIYLHLYFADAGARLTKWLSYPSDERINPGTKAARWLGDRAWQHEPRS